MYTEKTVPKPEYRVRTVPRYIVTRYCFPYESEDGRCGSSGHSEVLGQFDNEQRAFEVAQAMAATEGGSVST